MDTENLLRLLKEHKVRFVIIGATAFPVHGYSRATLDIDLFIEPNEINAKRTRESLKSFGYDVSDTVTIDFGYRYYATADPDFDGVEVEYSGHNFLAGVRLAFQ